MTTLNCIWLKVLAILCLSDKLRKKTVSKNCVVNKINSACRPGLDWTAQQTFIGLWTGLKCDLQGKAK